MYASDPKDATILIVDDEPTNVKLLEKSLRAGGYRNIHATTDPRQVVDHCLRHPCDLVLLDLNMPYMDGFAVMDSMKQALPESPPVLMLTAQTAREARLKALECGARDYVTKPFDRAELMARIRNLVENQLFHKAVRGQKAMLEDEVNKRTKELSDTRLEIVRRLGRAAEYRDNETGLHIIRMSKFAAMLAREAAMGESMVDLVLHASPMHDIGKIGIPDHILLKPGRFEPREWEIMKTHTTIGADILSGHHSDLLEVARVIALSHHEKWDGSGYPYGLAGDAIPVVGRIVALADVFDALTSERPYKKAWTVEAAVEYIDANSGKHFDPDLVTCFHSVLPDILEVKEEYAEPPASHEQTLVIAASRD